MARMNDAVPTLAKDDNGQYPKYAWPGGYPIFYVTADNGTLCATCANTERSASTDDLDAHCPDDDQWRIVASDINWEDSDLQCDHCNARIESAYGEDDSSSKPEDSKS